MEIRTLLAFLKTAEKLKCNTRHSQTSSGRQESVAEHSWRLALTAYLVKDEYPGIDAEKLLVMCLFHDLGEAVTGDIPAFEKTQENRTAEAGAVSALLLELPEPYRSRLRVLFAEYERQETTEARLARALDKLEALIQHNEAGPSTWLPLEYELQLTYGRKECAFSPYTQALRDAVRKDSLELMKSRPEEAPGVPDRRCGTEWDVSGTEGKPAGDADGTDGCCGKDRGAAERTTE